jgi:hypothetical protein
MERLMPKLGLARRPSVKPKVNKRDPDLGFATIHFVIKSDSQKAEILDLINYVKQCSLPTVDVEIATNSITMRNSVGIFIPLVWLGDNPYDKMVFLCGGKHPQYYSTDEDYLIVKPKTPVKKICVELEESIYDELMSMCKRRKKTMRQVIQDLVRKG